VGLDWSIQEVDFSTGFFAKELDQAAVVSTRYLSANLSDNHRSLADRLQE
jgi:hypothetical protein